MAGFREYLKFIIKRERIMSSVWFVLCVGSTMLIALIFPSLLGDEIAKTAMQEMLKSPAMVAMLGPAFEGAEYTASVAFAHMMMIWVMIAVAVMNIFFVGRHTRGDEEQGRLEMLRSLPLGRLTNASATIVLAIALNVVIALASSVAILIVNFEGCSASGAFSYSFGLAAFGIVMAAISLISAQIFSTIRGANGAAFAALGVFYIMRIAGDYSDSIISYISPMGLTLRIFPFYKDNIYPILVQLALSAALIGTALLLCTKRDVGEGIIHAKKGRATAKKWLLSPLGFAVRLSKNTCIVWCVVVFVVGAMYGSMLGDVEGFLNSNDFYKQMLQLEGSSASLTQSFIGMLFLVIAHIAAIPIITIAGKIRAEEHRGRLEQILARSVKRTDLMLAFIAIAFVESVLVLFSGALGLYVTSMNVDVISFGSMLGAGMSYLPAMWLFLGMGILLAGALPRGGIIVWLLYSYSFAVTYLGEMLNLPKLFKMLSPFYFVPRLPVEEFRILQLLLLTALAIVAAIIGVLRFKKRDIQA